MKELAKIAKTHGETINGPRRGKHDIYNCAGLTFPVPRHKEIAEGTAKAIIQGLSTHLENRS